MKTASGPLRNQSGQVEVETAVVLPVAVFLLLGLIQLGLLHQARIIAEYAAYRATRAGALYNMDKGKMEAVAVGALLPILSYDKSGAEVLSRTDSASRWAQKYIKPRFKFNRMLDVPWLKYAEIIVCEPLKRDVDSLTYSADGGRYVPFDNPEVAGGSGKKTKLRVELILNYRLIIPFADWVIYRMWRGQEITKELHLDMGGRVPGISFDKYEMAANAGVHIIPIVAQYSMKLHSDVHIDSFPKSNECH
jgi:hypothetical protein